MTSESSVLLDDGYFSSAESLKTFIQNIQSGAGYPTLKTKLKNADKIVWPCVFENHWYLICIEKKSDNHYEISCLDSLNKRKNHQRFFEAATGVLNALFSGAKLIIEPKSLEIPTQDNDYDCGVAACYFAERFLKGQSINNFSSAKKNYTGFRPYMAEQIIEACKEEESEPVLANQALLAKKQHLTNAYKGSLKSSRNFSDDVIEIPNLPKKKRL